MVTSPEKTVTPLSDQVISELFQDTYNRFWKKWRGNVPPLDSKKWDEIVNDEIYSLFEKYHQDERAKLIILWFMDQLCERAKKNEHSEEST